VGDDLNDPAEDALSDIVALLLTRLLPAIGLDNDVRCRGNRLRRRTSERLDGEPRQLLRLANTRGRLEVRLVVPPAAVSVELLPSGQEQPLIRPQTGRFTKKVALAVNQHLLDPPDRPETERFTKRQ
jgi:hypothetical protein